MTSDPVERFLRRVETHQRRAILRPLAPGEIVDRAMRLYQAIAGPLIPRIALPSLVAAAAVSFVLRSLVPHFLVVSKKGSWTEPLVAFTAALVIGLPIFLVGLANTVGQAIGQADVLLNSHPSEPVATWPIIRLLLRLVLLASAVIFLSGFVMSLGGLLAQNTRADSALPGIVALAGTIGVPLGAITFVIMVTRHSLALPALVLGKLSPAEALRRGRDLMKAQGRQSSADSSAFNGMATLGAVSVFLILGHTIADSSLGFSHLLTDFAGIGAFGRWLEELLGILPMWLFFALLPSAWATFCVVLYFERQVRLEGLDITALAAEMGSQRA